MISFVVPAHNEAKLLGRTLAAVSASARTVGEPWEAIVVDDASTDRTAEEVAFGSRLKRQGRFVILRECVATSGRKVRAHSALGLLRVGVRLALGRRSGLDYWYGPLSGTGRQPPNRTHDLPTVDNNLPR